MAIEIDLDKHIYEGWTVQDFINDMTYSFETIMSGRGWHKPFKSYDELKAWCINEQPYYKKHIPEVYQHFKNRFNEKQ